jgi:hypothetical protein
VGRVIAPLASLPPPGRQTAAGPSRSALASLRSYIATGLYFDGQGKEFVYVHYQPEECLGSPAFGVSFSSSYFTLYAFLSISLLPSSLGGTISGACPPCDQKDVIGWEVERQEGWPKAPPWTGGRQRGDAHEESSRGRAGYGMADGQGSALTVSVVEFTTRSASKKFRA